MPTQILDDPRPAADVPERSLSRSLCQGTSSIGVAVSLERGMGFVAHLLAARIGGTQVFGTYSLALTTANSVAAYAGAGIGTTANRFSGMYVYGTPEYTQLQRTLTMVSAQSALIVAVLLWFTAGPIASNLIGKPSLTPLLHLAALSSAAIMLLECMRGFLIGQRRYRALLVLAIAAGGGMLLILPIATLAGPTAMVAGQATAALGAVIVCAVFARSLGVRVNHAATAGRVPVSKIWLFGLGQLLGVVGLNAAGWLTASLVSRSDQTMLQMSFYIAATQIRNVIAMVPGLVQQSCYALLTKEAGADYGGPDRVLLASTMLASVLALGIAGTAVAILPWVLTLLYGRAFGGAEAAASIAIATALVHMAGAPAVSRLTILSLRMIGAVNGLWAVAVMALGPVFIPRGGAVPATAIMLAMHLVNTILVLACLWKKRALPANLTAISIPMIIGSVLFAVMGWMRFAQPSLAQPWVQPGMMRAGLSLAIFAFTLLLIGITLWAGRAAGCVPPVTRWRELAASFFRPGPAGRLRGGAAC
jgi:O-antigen/teichoic acid export membrane protein